MQLKNKFASLEQARAYVEMLSVTQLIEGYSQLLWETQADKSEPIKITEKQFRTMFKIVGQTADGSVERRGRKRKEI